MDGMKQHIDSVLQLKKNLDRQFGYFENNIKKNNFFDANQNLLDAIRIIQYINKSTRVCAFSMEKYVLDNCLKQFKDCLPSEELEDTCVRETGE